MATLTQLHRTEADEGINLTAKPVISDLGACDAAEFGLLGEP